MNKRQWIVLMTGIVFVAALVIFGATPQHPPVIGPVIENSPGHYSATLTTVHVMPEWAMAAALGLVVLTGMFTYRSQSTAR